MTQSGPNPPKESNPLQSVAEKQTWKGASPNKLMSTSRIWISLARAQHKVPENVPDTNPSLRQMTILENTAANLSSPRSNQLDKTLVNINENIDKIGTAGTKPAIQLQSQFSQRTATLRADFQTVATKQNTFKDAVEEGLQVKNNKFSKVIEELAQNKEPNKNLLSDVTTKFTSLSNHSEELIKEEKRVNEELKVLDRETKQTAIAVTGEEAQIKPGPEKSAPE